MEDQNTQSGGYLFTTLIVLLIPILLYFFVLKKSKPQEKREEKEQTKEEQRTTSEEKQEKSQEKEKEPQQEEESDDKVTEDQDVESKKKKHIETLSQSMIQKSIEKIVQEESTSKESGNLQSQPSEDQKEEPQEKTVPREDTNEKVISSIEEQDTPMEKEEKVEEIEEKEDSIDKDKEEVKKEVEEKEELKDAMAPDEKVHESKQDDEEKDTLDKIEESVEISVDEVPNENKEKKEKKKKRKDSAKGKTRKRGLSQDEKKLLDSIFLGDDSTSGTIESSTEKTSGISHPEDTESNLSLDVDSFLSKIKPQQDKSVESNTSSYKDAPVSDTKEFKQIEQDEQEDLGKADTIEKEEKEDLTDESFMYRSSKVIHVSEPKNTTLSKLIEDAPKGFIPSKNTDVCDFGSFQTKYGNSTETDIPESMYSLIGVLKYDKNKVSPFSGGDSLGVSGSKQRKRSINNQNAYSNVTDTSDSYKTDQGFIQGVLNDLRKQEEEEEAGNPNRKKYVYLGNEAQRKRGVLTLAYPYLSNQAHTYNNYGRKFELLKQLTATTGLGMKEYVSDSSILMVENNPFGESNSTFRSEFANFWFEEGEYSSICFVQQSVLSMYAYGLTTGLCVDSSANASSVVPVYEGYVHRLGSNEIPFGGQQVHETLQRLLSVDSGNQEFEDKSGLEILREVKESIAFVNDSALRDSSNQVQNMQQTEVEYELPDKNILKINKLSLCECSEFLFDTEYRRDVFNYLPSINALQKEKISSLPSLVLDSLKKSDSSIRGLLGRNIVLSGGNTDLKGFDHRLNNELNVLLNGSSSGKSESSADTDGLDMLKIHKKTDVKAGNLPFIGASILSKLPIYQSMCITQDQFSEYGDSYLSRILF